MDKQAVRRHPAERPIINAKFLADKDLRKGKATMMEHRHIAVWPETRFLLQSLKRSLGQVGQVVPVTMAGLVHAALCRLSESIERPSEREAVRREVRSFRVYQRVQSDPRRALWWHKSSWCGGVAGGSSQGATARSAAE